jgi:LmbE family N-acetylglucosaminyl deacetylase
MPGRETVLSVMAHPDDAEFFCTGTMALLQEKGFDIHIASMTPGDKGSREHPAERISGIRFEEGRKAAAKVRGHYHCLDRRDLMITYDRDTIQATVELLREVAPSIVITHSPQDYMPDHEFTSIVVRNACFGAPAPNFDTERRPARPATDKIPHLYYASPAAGIDIFGRPIPSTLFIDISKVIGLKTDMLSCHESQRAWLEAHHGIDEYLEEMKRWSAALGREIGVEYAEGFRQHVGHPYPQDDRLAELLGGVRKNAP